MKHVKLYESFLNESKIGDLEKALDKTPAEKFDLIANIKGMNRVLYTLGLEGISGEDATEEQRDKLFKAVDNKMYYSKLPISYFFDAPNKLPKGAKLVHLTNHADDIVKNGFTRGTQDLYKLGMSWGSDAPETRPGWNYAFPADYIDYAYKSLDNALKHWHREQVVEFEADCVVAYHYGDQVYQALFWGPSAKNIVRIK